jgi:hypothetical protein
VKRCALPEHGLDADAAAVPREDALLNRQACAHTAADCTRTLTPCPWSAVASVSSTSCATDSMRVGPSASCVRPTL